MKLASLQKTNPAYAPERWGQIRDLYEGGWSIIDDAKRYLPQLANENAERYEERVKQASYLPYLGMIADQFAAGLFKRDLTVSPMGENGEPAPEQKLDPYWADFGANVDLRGNAFSMLARKATLDALLFRRALVSVDLPALDVVPSTRAEEDAMGAARAYAFSTEPEELIDWQHESRATRVVTFGPKEENRVEWTIGRFRWCITRRCVVERASPEEDRVETHEYTVWRMAEGVATFERYRVETGDKAPKPEDDINPYASGQTAFTSIPLLELEIPAGLWLGNKLGPLALEHFRRRSALNSAETRTLIPTPVAFLGAEIGPVGGEMPSTVQQNPSRAVGISERMASQGYLVLGKDDKLEYPTIDTAGLELADSRLDRLVDEMFRVSHMMAASVSSTSTATGRSGASKAEDRNATNTILSALAFIVKDFSVCIYDFVTVARAEKIRWVATGLDSFVEADRAQLLAEAGAVSMLAIPSKTFRVEYTRRLAEGLAGDLSPEQSSKIAKEIEAGISDEDVALQPPVDPLELVKAKSAVQDSSGDDEEDV